jgi:hypothetical protein
MPGVAFDTIKRLDKSGFTGIHAGYPADIRAGLVRTGKYRFGLWGRSVRACPKVEQALVQA